MSFDTKAFDMGFNFLEDALAQHEKGDAIGILSRQIGYKRVRAQELLEHPERLRLTELVRIAEKSGLEVKLVIKTPNKIKEIPWTDGISPRVTSSKFEELKAEDYDHGQRNVDLRVEVTCDESNNDEESAKRGEINVHVEIRKGSDSSKAPIDLFPPDSETPSDGFEHLISHTQNKQGVNKPLTKPKPDAKPVGQGSNKPSL